jgi:transcriptional regulator with XRE-family HTH domain
MNYIKSNLVYLRRKNNVTLQLIADITKSKHRTTVKSWERGDSNPPIDKLIIKSR